MKLKKPSMVDYFELPNPGLWAYFKHNEEGNSEDYRPPFWKGESRETVLAQWQRKIDALGVEKQYPGLYEFEMDMKSKVGPMSIQLPLKDRVSSIEDYFTQVTLKSEPLRHEAILQTQKFFSRAGGIRLRSKQNVVANMRLSTNAGNPWFTKRRLVAQEAAESDVYFDRALRCWMIATPNADYRLAAILGWRGQEGGISDQDVKQRVVWMMSMGLNIHELQFYQPAIAAMQRYNLIPAYVSMDAVDDEVTALFRTKGTDDAVICTDFTKFDQHFNLDMQNAANVIEDYLMTQNNYDDRELRDYYFWPKFEIPIICSEDMMIEGPHGMGSGSGGTNFDECMSHKALQFEAALDARQHLNPHSMAYGDDGILTFPGIDVEKVIRAYERHGQEMNVTKQYVSKHECVVLRRWHSTKYVINGRMVGVYSTFRALGRLLAQERFYDPEKWSGEMVTLRALSILENCKWSPYFHEFIDFVITGDKYRLGLDLPGFFDNLQSKAQEAIENFPDFLGYTKSLQQTSDVPERLDTSINDWEVVKYLKTLRK
nr:MAG: RNA-dependent RNA polymerase [Porcine picobirnavirus]